MAGNIPIGRRGLLAGIASLAALGAAPARAVGPTGASLMLSAADFGLVPDSAADQSDLLQKAIEAAASRGLPLLLPGGSYRAGNLKLGDGAALFGVGTASRIIAVGSTPVFLADGRHGISLSALGIDGSKGGTAADRSGLVAFTGCEGLRLEALGLPGGPGNGIFLDGCSGEVSGCAIGGQAAAAIFAINSQQLSLTGNRITNCDNGGILIWRDAAGPDGTIVSGNHIAGISAKAGGSGQNGNGINIFRADNVVVSDNVVTDCDFSAIRANTTRNSAIRGNTCTGLREVAIYSEFAFSGSVISGNIVDGASGGISLTNLDQGGRLGVCSGNIVRNILPSSPTNPDATPFGIYAEADTAITGNTVANVPGLGIGAGYGKFLRNVIIADNVVSEVDTGIGVSVADGAGPVRIAGNLISGARVHAIAGLAWDKVASPDLAADATRFANVSIEGNVVGP